MTFDRNASSSACPDCGGTRVPVDAGRGLGRVVMAVLEILRELLERQVLRRVDAGSLTADQVERLGQALIDLEHQFARLREAFDISEHVEPHLPTQRSDHHDGEEHRP